MEEIAALHAELGSSVKLGADTTSENEENYPQPNLTLKQRKRKRPLTGNAAPFSKGIEDLEDIRPVFSTLHRSQLGSNLMYNTRDMTEDSYRAMLVAHKRRKMQHDVN